jgi:hypothetical protein
VCKLKCYIKCKRTFVCCKENSTDHVGSKVLTAMIRKSSTFCDIVLCGLMKVNRGFGGKYGLHLQGIRETGLASGFMLVSFLAHYSAL